jgi:hypothetical protein
MKFGKSQIKKKTPSELKKLGNALIAATTGMGVVAGVTDHATFAITIIAIGAIGRALVEFFGEDESQ